MSNFLLIEGATGTGRLLRDDGFSLVVLDPCQIFVQWGTVAEETNVVTAQSGLRGEELLTDIAASPVFRLEGLGPIVRQTPCTSAILGGIASKPAVGMESRGGFTVSALASVEHLVGIINPRENGIRLDPSFGFLLTDDGRRLITDNSRPAASPLDLPFSVTSQNPPPMEPKGAVAGKFTSFYDFIATNTFPTLSGMPLEHVMQVTSQNPAADEALAPLSGKAPSPSATQTNVARKSVSPEDNASRLVLIAIELMERTNAITVTNTGSVDESAAIKRTSPTPFDEVVQLTSTGPSPLAFSNDVHSKSPAVPAEHLLGVRQAFAIPLLIHGGVASPATLIGLEWRGSMKVGEPVPAEILHRGGGIGLLLRMERLGGIGPSTIGRMSFRGAVASGTVESLEFLAHEAIKEAAAIERLGGLGPKAPSPENSLGTIAPRQVIPETYSALIERIQAANLAIDAHVAGRGAVPADHISAIRGQTPGRADFQATIASTRPIPDAFAGAVAGRVAAVLEETVAMLVLGRAPAAWSGALALKMPVPADFSSRLQARQFPAVLEIAMQVTAQGRAPVEFYGYAMIASPDLSATIAEPNLEATDAAINLEAESSSILLIGKVD